MGQGLFVGVGQTRNASRSRSRHRMPSWLCLLRLNLLFSVSYMATPNKLSKAALRKMTEFVILSTLV